MILAEDEAGRRAALAKLLPMQRDDFVEHLRDRWTGCRCTIRLLDPPLHEFLPHGEAEIAELAEATGVDADKLQRRAEELHEFNPMLGHRGCRLGDHLSRDLRDAGARDLRGGLRGRRRRRRGADARDHDPAGRHEARSWSSCAS